MAIEYTWTVANLERETDTGGVVTVHWRVNCQDGGCTASAYGTAGFTPNTKDPDFVPFDQLTEADVLEWVYASLVEGEETPAEAKAIAKEIRNTLEANTETVTVSATSVSADTDPKPGTIVPNLGTPLISEKAEKSMGMLWFLVVVFLVAVVGVWLQEAGIIGWADRIVE